MLSHFLNRLKFLKKGEAPFADGYGKTTSESRAWEESYRGRWKYDKMVRSTHGVNCTGSCSWKIYVKSGIVTWETQQTDYPRTKAGMPNHEPRGCARGASYSWYLYSANRLKYPMARAALVKNFREKRKIYPPVKAWEALMADQAAVSVYQKARGHGGFVRISWSEAEEMVAAANIYTAAQYGPDRIAGFSPIPAMSMVSYAAGARYLSLIGGTVVSFYDWYCDLPPASPQTWGEQTDVSESADWYNANYLILWGSNLPQTRTPDAHFMSEARYKGTKIVAITPDYAEVSKFSDEWLHPKQGTDAALAMAMGHVILKEFHIERKSPYFEAYCRQYTDMPNLVRLVKKNGVYMAERYVRASDIPGALGEKNNPQWKTLVFTETGELAVPSGSIGFRWGQESAPEEKGRWHLRQENAAGEKIIPTLSLAEQKEAVIPVAFPYFGAQGHAYFTDKAQEENLFIRHVPVRKIQTHSGEIYVASVFDLNAAHYGIDRGFGGECASSYDAEEIAYTPAWQEKITGIKRETVVRIAREFAQNAQETSGQSMVILGAGLTHWYHMDMSYRAIIAMLLMCGCVGKPGGGWAHYVGQEKLRPQTGWNVVAAAADWNRPARQMNGTSFFYAHTDQWRYETLKAEDLLSPLADREKFSGSLIDFNVRAERMGWLPSAPHFNVNPLGLSAKAKAAGLPVEKYLVSALKSGEVKFASEDPDNPANFPRNLFIWRSNILGASGKGHEYFLKHLLGADHAVLQEDLGNAPESSRPEEVVWHDKAPEGKLDLLVTLDFRMSTTCLYSDIVLPSATFYEKNDLNTSDMHPFIHPLSAAVDPVWESRSDWEIYKHFAKKFSELSQERLGVEEDVVATPILHDTPFELAQALGVEDWKKGECEPVPGRTMPRFSLVERDYAQIYEKYISLGPLLEKLGNGGKGISWRTEEEVSLLAGLNRTVSQEGISKGRPKLVSDIDAAEAILALAPETNGEVAVKAWAALSGKTGRDHTPLALPRKDDKIRFRDLCAQPRKVISSPIWSGIESEEVNYCAGYTNIFEYIPWRTLTGRQQFYQDHEWMIAFGEGFAAYKPPVDMRNYSEGHLVCSNGNPEIALNFVTPHQKWGIHSTYSDNLLMLTLNRGGAVVWLSEKDAQQIGVKDNDWLEIFNHHGTLTARAVVSQRVPEGMTMMYHAQERMINIPGSEITGKRGGIHNSVTRVVLNPVHMIGGYAHLSYGFNYYGTVGSNRDGFVIVRKMKKVEWLDSAG